jgi:hypothetical protein
MFEHAGETVRLDSEKMAEKVNRITEDIEKFVKGEIRELFNEVEEAREELGI